LYVGSSFYEHFPSDRRHLIGSISGNSIISEMSSTEFRTMLIECLTGRNPRIHTENWAQSRVFHGVFTGIQEMYASGLKTDPKFITNAPNVASLYLKNHHERKKRLEKNDVLLCQWVCNLTSKGWDNILQANSQNLITWGNSVKESVNWVKYGDLETNLINMTIYNASLAKKGGLKSAMGNLFEPLLLFTSLRACGLKFVTEELYDSAKIPCFVLNVNEGRQSDAQIKTTLSNTSKIDIDIGFIGKGNPEIIADKTQRFGNLLGGGKKPLEGTIIIVSAIPETEGAQLVVRQATILGAKVVTMSGCNWIYELSKILIEYKIPRVQKIPEDIGQARSFLAKHLPSSQEIINIIPRNLTVPSHW
jgi:hypothetical protein